MLALSNQLIENKALMFSAAAIAFFVAAVLILLVFRLAFGRRLRMPGSRARQMRLGIVDAFDVDRQRQLVLVRRDNVEHLIMIGGPNDILIESQIVRTDAREIRNRDKEAREREPNYPAEPKLSIPPLATSFAAPLAAPLAPEPQPAAATEPKGTAAIPPLPGPGIAPIGPGSRQSPGTPAPRRPLSPPATSIQKPLPPHEPTGDETYSHGTPPSAPMPPARPPQPGEPPAFMRWPTRPPMPPTEPKRPAPTPPPPIPDAPPAAAAPEAPPAGPPAPSLEGLESLEEEMAKLLGRGPTKP